MRIFDSISAHVRWRHFHAIFIKYITLSAILFSMLPETSFGQAQFINTRSTLSFTDPNIPDRTGGQACFTQFSGTFPSVGAVGTIKDINVTVAVNHLRRGDLRVQLRRNSGTSPQLTLIDGVGFDADHLNVTFDDDASASITTHVGTADNPANTTGTNGAFRPSPSNFSAYIGQSPANSWTLNVCDLVGGVVGSVDHAYLDITRFVADLSLTKTVSNPTPRIGETITYELTIMNSSASEVTANAVAVRDLLSPGLTFVSATPDPGTTYTSSSGTWTVGSLPVGQSRKLFLSVRVNNAATPGSVINDPAEIVSSSELDNDSTPNNGITTEDDYASVNLTILNTPGIPPNLTNNVCTPANVGTILLDWNSFGWTSGSTSYQNNLTGIGNVSFNVVSNTTFATPLQTNSVNTGGGPPDASLHQNLSFPPGVRRTTTTLTLPNAVPGAQFTIFDVDGLSSSVRDMITITGRFMGNIVNPVLTNGATHLVSGNQATGFAPSPATSADGNLVVTFDQPIDSIIITYDGINASSTAAESISVHDILFCAATTTLSVTTSSEVIVDPVSATNPKAIPEATVRHCVTITNTGIATADNITSFDPLPANITPLVNRLMSGPDCASATTPEDDDPFDGSPVSPIEADGIGAGYFGDILRIIIYSLPPGESRAITYETRID